jgi:hypothetical protein
MQSLAPKALRPARTLRWQAVKQTRGKTERMREHNGVARGERRRRRAF